MKVKFCFFLSFSVFVCSFVFVCLILIAPKKSKSKNTVNLCATGEINSLFNMSLSKEEKAVSVSSSDTVLGKVTERYISPYTANTSYNNVFLKNSTDLQIDIKSLLTSPLSFSLKKDGDSPKVLIYHTHATESYLDCEKDFYTKSDTPRNRNKEKNMVLIGKTVSDILNKNGVITLHDTTLHDYPSYNESYSNSAKTVVSYKKKYPSINIFIDIHRDSITDSNGDKTKLTKDINGKKAAQIMLVMGSQSGGVTNFPDYKENLKLAVKIQDKIESTYPGLARSLSLMPKNYNESLSKGSVLIEIGTDANTLKEATYSAELLGECLSALFKEL